MLHSNGKINKIIVFNVWQMSSRLDSLLFVRFYLSIVLTSYDVHRDYVPMCALHVYTRVNNKREIGNYTKYKLLRHFQYDCINANEKNV